LKKKEAPKPAAAPAAAVATGAPVLTGPVTSRCIVEENGVKRTFMVTVEPATATGSSAAPAAAAAPAVAGTPVHSAFAGEVEVVDILVKVGDTVTKGQSVAKIEAMKATHEVKAPVDGKVAAILVSIGDEIDSSKPILTID
jgi:biotin carboxyl carrier protein